MSEKAKEPVIRFKGFSDEWEEKKFSDIAARESTVQKSSSAIPSVEYEDVVAEAGQLNKDVRSKKIEKSGIVFDGSQVLYGKLRPYLHNWLNPNFKGVAVGDWWVLKPIEANKDFLYRLIQTQQFDNIANQSAGSKMPRADWNLISNSKFMLPKSLSEQQKIGSYFRQLDRLITLCQRKYNKLASVKKSMLQKMFPASGQTVPALRFAGFTDKWEVRKLGEVGKTFTGLSGKTAVDFGHGEAKFLPYLNIFNNPIADTSFLESIEIDNSQNQIQYGDVFFTTSSETPEEVGMSSVWLGKSANIYLNSFCFGFRPTIEFNPYYLGYLLRSDTFRKPITILAQGISRFNISKTKVMEIEIPLPSLSEQQKIGSYFRQLDHLIALHQQELQKLQNLKKACLKKMFV